MTKSQNTKNEQQNDLCITSEQLTDKWKKGELENGTYYVRLNHDSSTIDVYDCGVWWSDAWQEITEVLAEVPSYEQWQEKLEENIKLKGLLKESRFLLGKTPYENMSQYLTFTDVMKRIDEILGEK